MSNNVFSSKFECGHFQRNRGSRPCDNFQVIKTRSDHTAECASEAIGFRSPLACSPSHVAHNLGLPLNLHRKARCTIKWCLGVEWNPRCASPRTAVLVASTIALLSSYAVPPNILRSVKKGKSIWRGVGGGAGMIDGTWENRVLLKERECMVLCWKSGKGMMWSDHILLRGFFKR